MMERDINILIVDDFPGMRDIIKGILKDMGFGNFYEAEDGEMAIKVLETQKIDLVISDLIMPKMGGLELLKRIKGSEKWKEIPFIIVTADGDRDNVLAAIDAGVNNYVVKPFAPETLQGKVQSVLK